jgi:hypothetical protein
MDDSLFLLGIVALTSVLAYFAARRFAGLQAAGLAAASARLLECAGLALGFYLLDLAAGFAAVLVLRKLTGAFIGLYVNTDGTLPVLATLQAIVFQWWRAEGGRGGA